MSCSVKMVKKKWLRFAILLWPLPNLTLFHQNFDSTKILLVHPKFNKELDISLPIYRESNQEKEERKLKAITVQETIEKSLINCKK